VATGEITREQVDRYGLTVIQKYDGRDKKHHDAVETEALSQIVIVEIVRNRLNELLPQPLADVHEREASERERLRRMLRRAR
jgi:hypothetical protein